MRRATERWKYGSRENNHVRGRPWQFGSIRGRPKRPLGIKASHGECGRNERRRSAVESQQASDDAADGPRERLTCRSIARTSYRKNRLCGRAHAMTFCVVTTTTRSTSRLCSAVRSNGRGMILFAIQIIPDTPVYDYKAHYASVKKSVVGDVSPQDRGRDGQCPCGSGRTAYTCSKTAKGWTRASEAV